MGERDRLTVKIPATKRVNLSSKTQKPDFLQSINLPIEQILHLQKSIGNQAVQRLFKSGVLQAKLKIGNPNDIYEKEADRVADQVMRMPEPVVQAKPTLPKDSPSCMDADISYSGSLSPLFRPLQRATPLLHHSPKVVAHPATMSVSGLDTSKSSAEIGTMAGTDIAYGWTRFQLYVNVASRPQATQLDGDRWNVFCPKFDIFFNVDNTIYITNQFPLDSCLFTSTLHHEVGHAFDEYGIVVRQEELLAADLGTLPGPDNPDIIDGRDAAQQRMRDLEEQARTFRDCAFSQACYDIARRGFARDSREYPTAFSECPEPRPPVPPVPDRADWAVPCTPPPQNCPRPVVPFP